jgi:glycosyltransferase involved in cell wall biosynthesis
VIRVLHVNASLAEVSGGGTAERTFQLVRALTAAGARCTVLTLDLGLTPARLAALEPAEVVPLACLSRRYYLPAAAPGRILAAVRDVDVVHLSGHWTVVNALAYTAARRLGTPHVVCPAGALPVYGRSAGLKRAYNAVVGRRLVRDAAAHVAITGVEREQFAAYGVDPPTVAVIPNGVDPRDLAAAAGTAALPGTDLPTAPFVGFVSRLNPIKGPDLLLEAFARAGDAAAAHHLVLAGPDEGLRADLASRAAQLGLADRVHLPGPVHGTAKTRLLRDADVVVVPSRQEAMSLVAVEAGAAGTPVLLTDVCGFAEVAGVGGGAVVPASVDGLARGLRDLLGEPAALPGMGRRLQSLVLGAYTWDRLAARHLRLYENLLRPVS